MNTNFSRPNIKWKQVLSVFLSLALCLGIATPIVWGAALGDVDTASESENSGDQSGNASGDATIIVLDDSVDGNASIGTHYIGSGDDLVLECSIPLEYFENAEMDGVLIPESNYTLRSGSTIITLSSAYLDTLQTGRHTVTMNYVINGRVIAVSTDIMIQNRPNSGEDSSNGTTAPNTENKETTEDSAENTSENTKKDETISETAAEIESATFEPVGMTAYIVDINGRPISGYTLEIHSTPMSATLNGDGLASFSGIEEGDHTLYLKDQNGNELTSKGIKIVFGKDYSIEGDVVSIIAGRDFKLNVQYDGEKLILLSVEGMAPKTSDETQFGMWIALMLVSATGLCAMAVMKKCKKQS